MNKPRSGLSLSVLTLLALLQVPRVVVHDLGLLPLNSGLYTFLAVAPLVIWLLVAVLSRTTRPFHDFLVLGLFFGLMLAATHQLTWDASWGSNPPHLHGNLEGKLNPLVESLLLRFAAVISSLVTGLAFGAAFGVVAVIANKLRRHPQ